MSEEQVMIWLAFLIGVGVGVVICGLLGEFFND